MLSVFRTVPHVSENMAYNHQMCNDIQVQNDIQTPDTRPSGTECDLHFI